MNTVTRRNALRTLAAGAAGLSAATSGLAHATPSRQRAFAAAAQEFGVPDPVLLAVSYLESRWDHNSGTPSTGAGFGPMHLTDVRTVSAGGTHHDKGTEDPRGDAARTTLHPRPPGDTSPVPSLQTLDLAAGLTGASPRSLRTDPTQNIRGGAAILARYQRELGITSGDPAYWYGAVARYSGATDAATAALFADEVFATMAGGASRVTDDGESVRLDATPVKPARAQLRSLDLPAGQAGSAEGPAGLPVEWIPAPYQDLGDGNYGNYDKADRPRSQQITHIVIHDTECTYDAAIGLVRDPAYLGWHYTLRSTDGHVAQHVLTKDIGWHAGNWYVNTKSIGVEHAGFAARGTWYTEAMYRSSAKLVRYLADRYAIPLDRDHILGHDNVPGPAPADIPTMHWDPGPYWDWAHYFDLLGAALKPWATSSTGLVMINPAYAANQPPFTGCDSPGAACTPRGSSTVVLRTGPRADAPLLTDPGLHPGGAASTSAVSDVGSRVSAGQRYAVADVHGDWTAIWFLGQVGWFPSSTAVPALGQVVTAKPGAASVPVYGLAYPEAGAYPPGSTAQQVTPLPYALLAGQKYAAGPVVEAEYYRATTFDATRHVLVRGATRYVQIQFGHRVAFVKLDDVLLVP